MAFWRRRTEDRSLPPAENQYPLHYPSYVSSPSWPHRQITPQAALAISDVWAAVRVLADAVSSLPLHVYHRAGESRERVTSGKLVDLLERPGPGTTQADLISSLMAHALIHGNAYIGKYRTGDDVTQLGLLDPDRIRPELEGGRLRYRYTPTRGPQQLLTDSDLIHVKGLSVDGLSGLSAVSQASRVIGLSDELVKHALSYFDSSEFQRPAGILRVGVGSPFGVSDDGKKRTKEKVRAEAKPHGVLVLEGDAEYTPITSPLDSAQFVEQRRLAAQEIARVFRIPPHMIGAPTGDSLTYSTVEQESINFVRYSLTPWLRRIELAISGDSDLAFQRQFVRFEVDALLRADSKTRAEVYARALDPISGWLDVDEVRALEDLPPRPARPAPLPIGNTNGSGPVPMEAESRSHDTRDEALADAVKALADRPAPVVNAYLGTTKKTVTFSDGSEATIKEEPEKTVKRVIRDDAGRVERIVDEPASEDENTTNGHVEVST